MFITLEGIDGAGKSTQASLLVKRLRKSFGEREVLWTREPGGWNGGSLIRKLLLDVKLTHPLSEVFLFLADRCEHVRQVIEPALLEDKIVVCERYNDSTLAYQAWGREIERDRIDRLFDWCDFPEPDLTFWLDISPEIALNRIRSRGKLDRIENGAEVFLRRIYEGFCELYCLYPNRIVRIDASVDVDKVSSQILNVLDAFLRK